MRKRPEENTKRVIEGAREIGARRAGPPSVEEQLYGECYSFDFFQAVRLLERLQTERAPVGLGGPPQAEIVRFRAEVSLDFPSATVRELAPAGADGSLPTMIVAFMGLTGPSGVLPRHYTEMLLRLQRDMRGAERYALRDWLDLFNHRLIALFYRAWEKYRFYIPFERGEYARREPDAFTRCLLSLVGLGMPALRERLRVACRDAQAGELQERVLARIDDLALLRYGGFLARRPRNAVSLEALLGTYLQLPVEVQQFQGQWLQLDAGAQTALGGGQPSAMGLNVVVGDRIWDVQSRIRIRLGPLSYERFGEFLPDRSATPLRKAIYLVAHLARLYVGPEMDVEIQLILRKEDVPKCRLGESAGMGACLGWNTWSRSQALTQDADEAVFEAEEVVWVA